MTRGDENQHTQPRSFHCATLRVPTFLSPFPSLAPLRTHEHHPKSIADNFLSARLFSLLRRRALPRRWSNRPREFSFSFTSHLHGHFEPKPRPYRRVVRLGFFQLGRQHSIDHDSSEWFSSGFDNTHPHLHHLESHDQAHPHQFQHQDTMHATVSPSRK